MVVKRLQQYSRMTSMAMGNFYHSVITAYPNCITKINSENDYFVGVKQTSVVSEPFISFLEQNGFHLHTVDKASHKGRGIDIDLKNPITGNVMTGSSSGTAINVFLGINDIGIGTDGGGSVLSPASALNLIGFIHPKIGEGQIDFKSYVKKSTDNISFTPSIGFISREIDLIKKIFSLFIDEEFYDKELTIVVDDEIDDNKWKHWEKYKNIEPVNLEYKYQYSREDLVLSLENLFSDADLVISKEGPIDVYGIGETIFGHFDEHSKEIQIQGKKGFVRVVNMCNAIGLIVPSTELSTGYLIIGRINSKVERAMFEIAELLIAKEDLLLKNYFLDHSSFFEGGYNP
ncbi:hypothetical protein A5868_002972 [Enterococcus sp. 12F9_DIV0723]|uniref:amidase family protein n=2 Tax=unclassified Enterococcus TaxID=2608891 RepID=UPI000B3E8E5A|nr:amidase family protein [Enterococcus sp. 12F9_DIV0723]OUZ13949.1 hypothetical protein A5868_002972 [Enterococcus sp. 12F9_DIV0723]